MRTTNERSRTRSERRSAPVPGLFLGIVAAILLGPASARAELLAGSGPTSGATPSASGERWSVAGVWSRRAGRSLELAPTLVDSTLVTISTDGRVSAWRLVDGRRLWSRRFKQPIQVPAAVVRGASGRSVVVATRGRGTAITALSPASGRVLWTRRIDGAVTHLVGADTLLLCREQAGRVVARSARDGAERWRRSAGEWESPPLAVEDGIVYAAAREDSVVALHSRDGGVLWRAAPGGRFLAAPVSCGPNLALASDRGEVVWLRRSDGALVGRSRRAAPQIVAGVSVEEDLVTVSSGGVVERGGPGGDLRWRFDLESACVASPVVADGHLLVATTRGQLRALGVTDGSPQWLSQARAGFRAPPLVVKSNLVLVDDRGNLHVYRF